jgi:ankyrin repeat protein
LCTTLFCQILPFIFKAGSCFGWFALGVAVAEKNEPMAKFLVELGADPNIKRARRETLLSAAILQSDIKAVEFLLVSNIIKHFCSFFCAMGRKQPLTER